MDEHIQLPAKELLHHPFILPSLPSSKPLTSTSNLSSSTAQKQSEQQQFLLAFLSLLSIPLSLSYFSLSLSLSIYLLVICSSASNETKLEFKRSDSIFGSSPIKPFLMGRSRLETEFEELEKIGSGGFGEVIKASRNSGTSFWSFD